MQQPVCEGNQWFPSQTTSRACQELPTAVGPVGDFLAGLLRKKVFVKKTTGFLHKQVAALPGSFVKETIGFLHKNVSGANRGGVVAARV